VIRVGTFVPRLPRAAWVVLGGDTLSAIGSGLTLPFFVVYLHRVRGIDLEAAALALVVIAVAGFAGNPTGGSLADRFGPRNSLIFGLFLAGLGAGALTFVHTAWQAFAAAAVLGFGSAVVWPAQDSLLAMLVRPEQRSSVFSVRHATLNAGFGIGALIAAVIVDLQSPDTFVVLYWADAATFLAFIPILLTLKVGGRPTQLAAEAAVESPGGYRTILTDWVFLRIWVLTAVLVAIGFSQLHASFPVFATGEGGISAKALSVAFAANTFTVVAAQLVVLRLMSGHRRTTSVALACGFWALAWAVTLLAGMAGGQLAVATFAAALVVFAIGETLLTPALTPMVNDIAPERLRGRYNGAYTLGWITGFMVGPVFAGVALGAGRSTTFFVALIGACGLAAVAALRLSARLPSAANMIGESESESASQGPVNVTPPTGDGV